MCKFFSFVMNDSGKIFYFNREQRISFEEDNSKYYSMDSHASICEYFNLNEDQVNKYEYLKELEVDSKCFDLGEEKQKIMDFFIEGLDLKKLVVDSYSAFEYCDGIKDIPEVRKYITDSYWAYRYCVNIKDDPEVRKYITESCWTYEYCRWIKIDQKLENI